MEVCNGHLQIAGVERAADDLLGGEPHMHHQLHIVCGRGRVREGGRGRGEGEGWGEGGRGRVEGGGGKGKGGWEVDDQGRLWSCVGW